MTFQSIGSAAGKITDRWAFYFAALGGKNPTITTEPQQGYYRTRDKGKQWEPVAIFFPEGSEQLVAYRAGREVRDVDALWTYVCRHPITFDAYQKAIDGGGFDDEPPAPVGHNSGETDPFERVRRDLADEKETAEGFLKEPVASQDQADKLGIWAKRFLDIGKRAETERVTEKEPHLDAGRAVDAKWKPLVDDAKAFADRLRDHVKPWLFAEKRKADEAARKAREEAERQRQEAAKAADDESRAAALKAAAEAEQAAESTKNASAGRTGARVSVRVEKKAKIVDFDACLMALKNHPDMRLLVQQLANRAVRHNVELAGVEVIEEEKIV